MGLICWVNIVLNIVVDMVDVLDVLLVVVWAVEVHEAVWDALWWLLVVTAVAVGLTRVVVEVRHRIVLGLPRLLNRCFI